MFFSNSLKSLYFHGNSSSVLPVIIFSNGNIFHIYYSYIFKVNIPFPAASLSILKNKIKPSFDTVHDD